MSKIEINKNTRVKDRQQTGEVFIWCNYRVQGANAYISGEYSSKNY